MRRGLSHWWRTFRTGLAFIMFGAGALVIAFVCLPVLQLVPGPVRERETRAQRLVHVAFRIFVRSMETLGLIGLSMTGTERLGKAGPRVVVANHPTLIDAVLLIACMPQADCVTKNAIWKNIFLRHVVRGAGYIANDRGVCVIEACADRLREGRTVLLFPEGTRSPMGQLGRFQRGAARLALQSGCEVVPVVITCSPPTLMKGQKWYDVPSRAAQVTLRVEEPISPKDFVLDHRSPALAARQMTASLRHLYENTLAHPAPCHPGSAHC